MRALLDVNVLIALIDGSHTSHRAARAWFAEHAALGWASCPITQNGCIRIMSNAGYPRARPPVEIAERLRDWSAHKAHQFWSDDLSLLDRTVVDMSRVHGPRQLTDAYLLALAVANNGRLVTFDGSIPTNAVMGAKAKHLVRL